MKNREIGLSEVAYKKIFIFANKCHQMEFRRKVELTKNLPQVSHKDKILLIGSCFSEHIGNMLVDAKFQCDVNPYGIQYNPHSIYLALREIMDNKQYTEADLFYYSERYRSFMHHGLFAKADSIDTLDAINTRIKAANQSLPHLNFMLLTFGTSWYFSLNENGQVVSNCHKLPTGAFDHKRLSVDDIVKNYTEVIQRMQRINPRCKFLFTVSPIRHSTGGAHGNQLSKAILLLAIEQLQLLFPELVFYFPAYEIVLDELRDYRFYKEDMNHVSGMAIDYVWQRFCDGFFSQETQMVISACKKIHQSLHHKPLNQDSEVYIAFLKQILLKIAELEKKYPILDLEKEKKRCHTLLKPSVN